MMNGPENSKDEAAWTGELRRRAEERFRVSDKALGGMSNVQTRRLVYELQIAQIELQLQNEELQRAQTDLMVARDRYSDLYNFAPVGYLTLTPEGAIAEANLTAATLLGTERALLIGSQLVEFFTLETHDVLHFHLRQVEKENDACVCDVAITLADESQCWLQLESTAVRDERGATTQYRTVLSNITGRKKAEQLHQRLMRKLLTVQEDERQHLARELHDEIMQTLTALQLNLDRVANDLSPFPESLRTSMALVDDLVDQIRSLSLDLHPAMLDELGLAVTLEWYCRQQAPRLGLQAHYTCEAGLPRPDPVVEVACFRVVQEAVTNVVKYAKVDAVWIDLRREGDRLHLSIQDRGVGFNFLIDSHSVAQGETIGLSGMRERMRLIGGQLDVQSVSGQGTVIHAWAPLLSSLPRPS